MQELVIEPQKEGKGRSFTAMLLAYVTADRLWSGGQTSTDDIRPIWAMFAGSDGEIRPFIANIQSGKKAKFVKQNHYSRSKDPKLELLKTAGYKYVPQKEAEGTLITAYLPDLFRMDPGMVDPAFASFVAIPSKEWLAAQEVDELALAKHLRKVRPETPLDEAEALAKRLGVLSHLFAVYLDRRIRCPTPKDGRFYFQFLVACLGQQMACLGNPRDKHYYGERPFGVHGWFIEEGTDLVGLAPGVAFHGWHGDIEKLLAEHVTLFFKATR